MAQDPEAHDASGAGGPVFMHQLRSHKVESRHGEGGPDLHLVRDLGHLGPHVALGLLQPLVGVDCHLSAERLGEEEDLASLDTLGKDDVVLILRRG